MRMRKISILLASLLLVTALGACRRGGRGRTSSSPVSESSQSSSEQQSTSSGQTTSSSKTSTSKTTSSAPSAEHTPEDVIKELCKNMFENDPVEGEDYTYDEENEEYSTGVTFGTEYASDEYLLDAISSIVTDFPEYITLVAIEPCVEEDETGNYGEAIYLTSDSKVYIEIQSYVYDTTQYGLCADIYVGYNN